MKQGLAEKRKGGYSACMSKSMAAKHSGHVGRRGTIVLPSSLRKRYGLNDGSLFISEERADGVLIRPAVATPLALNEVRLKIRQGLDELDRGLGIAGAQAETELKALSKSFRSRKPK
jgi:bifunctional DNA-binding transcriptional regulator/antitoxin component of YhaV-PrlF toxin-antitoxin module